MSFRTVLSERRDADMDLQLVENPRNPLTSIFEVQESPSGKRVTEHSALQITAVWRCVNIIASAIAKTDFLPYRRTAEGKERATNHYLFPLLMQQVNPKLSAFRFKRMMQAWLCLWGNAYAEVMMNGRGQITGFIPWRPDRVRIEGEGTTWYGDFYTYTMENGEQFTLHRDNVLHLRGLETDGIKGLSPIRAARTTLGLAAAAEEYGARFFANNGRPGGVLEAPTALSQPAQDRLTKNWNSIHRGIRGAHRIGILEEGLKYKEVGVPPEDMQFLETRQFEAIDIARLFGVPPHKIAELSRATFSNIEHQAIEFVQDCLGDWFATWSSECETQLLSERELATIELRFWPEKLLSGDKLARYRSYSIGRQQGWLSVNDIRDAEDMNRIEGGDTYLVALNMGPASNDAVESGDPDDPTDPDATDDSIDPPASTPAAAVPSAAKKAAKKAVKKAAKKQEVTD